MISSLLAVLSVLTVRSRFDDPDTWWHLKTGQIIWATHTIPTIDLFSYVTNHHAWVPHEWFSQVLIFGAYRFGGYSGLMVWLCLMTSAVLIAGYLLCSVYSGNAKVAFVGAMTLWLFSTSGLSVRPQMIGYLFLIIELLLIQLGRTRTPRFFLGLPLLFALWINCHGSFFFGLGVASIFLICSFFDFQLGSLVALPWDQHRRAMLGLALILSVAALFLNPIGIKQILYPLQTMFNQPIGISHSVEWMPLQLTSSRGLALLVMLVGILLLVIVQRSQLFWDELVLLSIATCFAVSHQRMTFVFGILAAPVLSRLLAPLWDGYDPAHDRPLPNIIMIVLSLLIIVRSFPSRQSLIAQVEQNSPEHAVEFIQNQRLSGNMLNEYVYGGYLIWALPTHPVFIDGRSDVFEATGVLADYGRWAMLQSDPNTLLNRYKISFCLLAQSSPMVQVMRLLPNWKIVYSDNVATIFVRTSTTGLSQDK